MIIEQGVVLKVPGLCSMPVAVVSKNLFNQAGSAMVCPVTDDRPDNIFHIEVRYAEMNGTVLCEQVRMVDLRKRGFTRIGCLKMPDIMNITDAIQSIFDYV